MTNNIGSRAKKIRELKNLTQEHIAKELGISQPAYSNIEKGESKLKEENITNLANALGVSLETLENFNSDNFLIHNNDNSPIFSKGSEITYNTLDKSIQNLYEKHISLLEKELERYKNKFGEI